MQNQKKGEKGGGRERTCAQGIGFWGGGGGINFLSAIRITDKEKQR